MEEPQQNEQPGRSTRSPGEPSLHQIRGGSSLRDKPNQVWVGDLTDIPNVEGPLYLAILWNLWPVKSRRRVGR
jgi:hypothetical protein